MGYSPDWQKQSYAKTSSASKVTQKGTIVRNELFHNAPSRLGLADGGDVTEEQLKKEGLEISNRENAERTKDMGAFEKFVDGFKNVASRFKDGNIDSKDSPAYYKYGAGRGQMERDKVRDAEAVKLGASNAGDNTSEWDAGRKPMMGDAASASRVSAVESKPEPAKYPKDGVFSNPTKQVGGSTDVEVRPFKEPEPIKGKPLKARPSNKVKPREPVKTQGEYNPDNFQESARKISEEQRRSKPVAEPVASPKKTSGRGVYTPPTEKEKPKKGAGRSRYSA